MKKTGYPLAYDIGGIILIAFSAIMILSLLSYSSLDNAYQGVQGPSNVGNWIGPGGALIAYVSLTVFGLLAFAMPIVLFLFGVSTLWRR